MKITKEWLKQHNACKQGIEAFINQKETDSVKILKLLIRSNKRINLEWANWLIVKLFKTKKQSIQYAVFAARLALPIFEQEYPKDLRPRKAIEAVDNWLKNPSKKNRELCKESAAAAASAVAAVYDASAYYAAYYATDASDAAATAAYVVAAYVTSSSSAYNETLTKILKYGITLL